MTSEPRKYVLNLGQRTSQRPTPESKAGCKRCESLQTENKTLTLGQPGYGQHYAKSVCAGCGAFIAWLPHPRVTAAFEKRATEARRMLTLRNLTEFQRGFLGTMTKQRTLSPRQAEIWQDMAAKLR